MIIIIICILFSFCANAQTHTFMFAQNSNISTSTVGEFIETAGDTLYFYGYTCTKGNAEANRSLAAKRITEAMLAYNLAGFRGVQIAVVVGETTKFGVDSLNRRVEVRKAKAIRKATMENKVVLKDTVVCDTPAQDSIKPVLALLNVQPITAYALSVHQIAYKLNKTKVVACPCVFYAMQAEENKALFEEAKDVWSADKSEFEHRAEMHHALNAYTEAVTATKACYKSYKGKAEQRKKPKAKRVHYKPTRGKSGRGLARIFPYINC
jgi:hypothetical protein